jgi:hypothetical protein|tara:strand:+ start:116 stop:631 length:516 start_codon:yes stop_codon:yes gene_type:complete
MRQDTNLQIGKLHPYLQDELPIAIKTTQNVARQFYPMLSEKFESINEFALHLQESLFEPLITLSCMLQEVKMPDKINLREVVQTTVFNYLKAYIENDLINFQSESKKDKDEIVISGFTLKVWLCKHGSLHVTFKGSPKKLRYFAAKAGATYNPISEEEKLYGISFIDGGIS